MNPWRWLLGAKVRVLRLRPGDVVVLECKGPLSPTQAEAVKAAWEKRFPDLPVAVVGELRLGGVVRPTTGGYASSGRPATDLRPPPAGPAPGAPTTTRPDPWRRAK